MAFKFDDKDIKFTKLFIDGDFRDSKTGKMYDLRDFVTGNNWMKVVEGDKTDVDLAVTAAFRAFEYGSDWNKMDYVRRTRFLYRLSELITRDFDYLVGLEMRTTGKTYTDVTFDLKRSIDFLRYYAGYTNKFFTRTDRDRNDYFEFVSKVPIGVVGLIGDHIDPLWTFIRLITPVLAAGNTLVYKPSFKTPLTTLYITKLMHEVGLPRGVVNIVTGKGQIVGEALGLHMDIKHITFTGRREVAKYFYEYALRSNMKKINFYLFEMAPLVVLEDADIDEAVYIAHHAAFYKDGRTRFQPRIFVHDTVYDRFVTKSIELVRKRHLGEVFHKETRVGSFVDELYMKNFMEYIEKFKSNGAKLEYGGKRYGDKGYVVEPAILTDIRDDIRDDHKYLKDFEVYGPLMLITRFKKYDEIYEYFRKFNYLTAAAFITKDFKRFKEFERRFNLNVFWYNTYHELKPYLTFLEHKKTTDFKTTTEVIDYIYFDEEYFNHDAIEYYLKNKTIDGLWEAKRYDITY